MWEWIAAIVLLGLAIWLMPIAAASMRRDQKRTGVGGAGSAMLELERVLAPSTEHRVEAQKTPEAHRTAPGDPPAPEA